VFASSVARHYGLADDVVEDVKLAVSEACTDPVEAGAGGEIRLEIARGGEALSCRIVSDAWTEADRPARELPEEVDPGALDRLQLVRALFLDARRSESDGAVTVSFSTASRETGQASGDPA
jgi:hypothetical protein